MAQKTSIIVSYCKLKYEGNRKAENLQMRQSLGKLKVSLNKLSYLPRGLHFYGGTVISHGNRCRILHDYETQPDLRAIQIEA